MRQRRTIKPFLSQWSEIRFPISRPSAKQLAGLFVGHVFDAHHEVAAADVADQRQVLQS